ncbi:MAG: hypothetical protein AB1792_10885 [Candidatus Zixiibacteriota bacterium]
MKSLGPFSRAAGWGTKPRSHGPQAGNGDWTFVADALAERTFAIRLHRFLRDRIPVLKAAVWTWTRLAASPHRFEVTDSSGEEESRRALEVLAALDRRIHPDRLIRFGGFDALLVQYFDALFTDGAVAGELTLLPSRRGLDVFHFVDVATLEFETDAHGQWQMWQQTGRNRIPLDSDAIFYQPLDAEAGRPHGKSLLAAVGFVARVEQELIRDMQKAMHNAGYHRLHVRITPPTQGTAEADVDYAARANAYFDSTVRALRDFDVDDNPITWNDVEITHVGPGAQVTASRNWYLNHRSMIEDVVAGCHLAPFMLGYSYGTTQTWARFKYEMVGRQIVTLQRAASRFCEWIAAIELALAGVEAKVRHVFDNRLEFDRRERYETERAHTDLVLRQLEAGVLTMEQARQRLQTETAGGSR